MSVADAALKLAEEGYRVAPATGKKLPTIPGKASGALFTSGWNAATNDPEVVALHWRHFWGPNILYATGAPSMRDVLDIDAKPGGLETYEEIKERLPRTFTYRTPSGGLHVQFRPHELMRIVPQGGLGLPGFEVKSTGGYCLAWFAVPGTEIIDDSPIAEWPGWILERATRAKPMGTITGRARASFVHPNLRFAGALVALEDAPEGKRHGLLFWCGRLAGGMFLNGELQDLDAAIEAVVKSGVARGKDEKECRRTAKDGAVLGMTP